MIEFRKLEDDKGENTYRVFINGIQMVGIYASGFPKRETGELYFGVSIDDADTAQQFLAHGLSEIPPLEHLQVDANFEDLELIDYIFIYKPNDRPYLINFVSEPDLATWPYPFSFAAYCHELKRAVEAVKYHSMTLKRTTTTTTDSSHRFKYPLTSIQKTSNSPMRLI